MRQRGRSEGRVRGRSEGRVSGRSEGRGREDEVQEEAESYPGEICPGSARLMTTWQQKHFST